MMLSESERETAEEIIKIANFNLQQDMEVAILSNNNIFIRAIFRYQSDQLTKIMLLTLDEVTEEEFKSAESQPLVIIIERIYKELLELREKAKTDKCLGLN